MSSLVLRTIAAALAARIVIAAGPAFAADPPALHGGMPPHGFRGAPQSFGGRAPQSTMGRGAPRFAVGRPGHDLGRFDGHDFAHFTPQERSSWTGGAWRHERHDGYLGWWWVVAGSWFFYPQPIYPYPAYVGPGYYYDYYNYYPTPSYYWYYCEDPPGYFPDVQACNGPWEPVPPAY